MIEKRCSKCRAVKPFKDFHRNRTQPDGLHNQCKECNNAGIRAHYRELSELHQPKVTPTEKKCPQCQTVKPSQAFAHQIGKPDKLSSHCLDCQSAKRREKDRKYHPVRNPLTEKHCNKCGTTKPIAEFYIRRSGYYSSNCRICCQKRNRRNWIKSQYGISADDVLRMKADQQDKCAICCQPYRLVIDHDHGSGEVRGLLCNDCNTGIGFLKDDTRILSNAIEYLNRSASTGCLSVPKGTL